MSGYGHTWNLSCSLTIFHHLPDQGCQIGHFAAKILKFGRISSGWPFGFFWPLFEGRLAENFFCRPFLKMCLYFKANVELALHPQHEASCDSEIQTKCWARVASSTWSVLWLWNTNKENPQTQGQKTSSKIVNNVIEQQTQRSIRKSRLKVASPNGLNSRSTKLEQCNNQRHLFYNDIVLCTYTPHVL